MPFPKTLAQSESQTASSRVLDLVTDSISYDDNRYSNVLHCQRNRFVQYSVRMESIINGLHGKIAIN